MAGRRTKLRLGASIGSSSGVTNKIELYQLSSTTKQNRAAVQSWTLNKCRHSSKPCPLGAISQSPLFRRVWQNSLFGFDNNSQAFFRQTIFAWQVFESAFEWQKNISVDTSNREIPVTADKPTYRQTGKKTRFLFYWTRKPFSFFMWDKFFDRNFFTIWEIISDSEKDEDNFFTFSFFVFIRQSDCFSCGHKFLIQRKMTKVFSLFS